MQLNAQFEGAKTLDILHAALVDRVAGRLAMVSSFGAEAAVLLHLIAQVDRATPVLFLDTALLFPETLQYQQDLSAALGLTDVRVLRSDPEALAEQDPYGALKFTDKDKCCSLRKTEPLTEALAEFDGWITGRKRFQAKTRAALDTFETDEVTGKVKLNPLAHWTPTEVTDYFVQHDLPRHPLVARGYPSIGCEPCTSPVKPGEDPRAGRWRGDDKTECGIHLAPKDAAPARTAL